MVNTRSTSSTSNVACGSHIIADLDLGSNGAVSAEMGWGSLLR